MKNAINKPIKNYIVLFVLFVVVFFVYNWLIRIYRVNQVAKSSVLVSDILTISFNDFDNYIIENPDIIIYMPTLLNINNVFEHELLDYIVDNKYDDRIIYLNIGNTSYRKAKEKFVLNDTSKIKDLSKELATFITIKDSEIIDSYVVLKEYDFTKVKQFIQSGNEVLEND